MCVGGWCVRRSVHVHTHGYRYGYTHGGQRTTPSVHLLPLPCLSYALWVVGCFGPWASGDCYDSTFHLPITVLELQPWELPCQLYMGSGESNSGPRMCVASAPAPKSPLKLSIYFIDFFDTIINEIVVWISFSDSILSMSPVFEYHKSSYYKYLYINFWVNICFHFSRVNTQ